MKTYRMLAAFGALTLVVAACGDDDDGAGDTTAAAVTTEAPTDEAPTTVGATQPDETAAPDTTTAGTGATGDDLCALAQEMFDQDGPPTVAQITRYQELAPAELQPEITPVAEALVPTEGDMVAFFNVVADDEIDAHLDAINAYEEENCGIPHSEDEVLPDDASREIEDDAARVDVTSLDFEFQYEPPTEAGRTSFVLTNEGQEAHHIIIVKLAEGVSFDEALAADDPEGMTEGEWDSDLAASGGEDEEAITFDLEPGNYGIVCFVPTADGTPHAFMGMTDEFTVAG